MAWSTPAIGWPASQITPSRSTTHVPPGGGGHGERGNRLGAGVDTRAGYLAARAWSPVPGYLPIRVTFLSLFASRFSFSDLPGFLPAGFCGDFSGMVAPDP